MQFRRAADLNAPQDADWDRCALDFLVGDWFNTKAESTGFARAIIERDGDGLTMQLFGVGDDGPVAWGPVRGEVFANVEEDGVPTAAMAATYDLGYLQVELQVRANKGVLVITHFTRFTDDSGRSNWVDREFFRRA